jgi:hypothetical protein
VVALRRNPELGTLRCYVDALGVSLRIVADFGDRELTIIDGLTAWTAVGPDSTG